MNEAGADAKRKKEHDAELKEARRKQAREFSNLKDQVCEANIELYQRGLARFTFGNASGIDRDLGLVIIKPSGVAYNKLKPKAMVVLNLQGDIVDGDLRPSSDTPTHLELYRAFSNVGGIVHTHSMYATAWAQAKKEIPCFGTTHADYFYGAVPVTEPLTDEEIQTEYELNTGRAIVRRFASLDANTMSAVLVSSHASFVWGRDVSTAVNNASYLEEIATMAYHTLAVNHGAKGISSVLLDKHFLRKHGKDAYYGQEKAE